MLRPTLVPSLALAVTVGTAGAVQAADCRTDLASAGEGMVAMGGAARTRAVTSREALGILGRSGGRSTALTFQREVEDFWRRKVRSDIEPEDLTVRYTLSEGGERTGLARHEFAGDESFPVRILPTRPIVLCENRDFRIISGGFTLIGQAAAIGMAGRYAVEIDVDVDIR